MYKIKPVSNVKKTIVIPPDKSISHRAVILASLCKGKTTIKNFLQSDDTRFTLACIKKLGVKIRQEKNMVTIQGAGMYFTPKRGKKPVSLFSGESGTTMRILSGLLCCQKFPVIFNAGAYLSRRPMGRIVSPLSKMGALISGKRKVSKVTGKNEVYPPLKIKPAVKIKGMNFKLSIASAQVKSAIMLAALFADKNTSITEPYKSRDHSERMFKLFGANIRVKNKTVICQPAKKLASPKELSIPGDFSSAAFFIGAGLILENSVLIIKGVNINPTRCGLLDALMRMGANIKIINKESAYESYADIEVSSSQLNSTMVKAHEIPLMIDEVPILCVVASFAEGTTEINGIQELKVKETNRINSMIRNLKFAGVDIREEKDGTNCKLIIRGNKMYKPSVFKSFGDHRTAMSMIIFAMALGDESKIDDVVCINKSFPQFISLIESLQKG